MELCYHGSKSKRLGKGSQVNLKNNKCLLEQGKVACVKVWYFVVRCHFLCHNLSHLHKRRMLPFFMMFLMLFPSYSFFFFFLVIWFKVLRIDGVFVQTGKHLETNLWFVKLGYINKTWFDLLWQPNFFPVKSSSYRFLINVVE